MAGVVYELIVYSNPNGERFFGEAVRHALYETRQNAEKGWQELRGRKDFYMEYDDKYNINEVDVL